MVRGLGGQHHGVDQHARHLDLAGVERPTLGDALDLRNDHAARVARGHGNRQRFERERLALHSEVAVRVGCGRADDAHMDREGLVEQVVLPVDGQHAHQVFGGARVELAAAVARVHKGIETHARERAGLARSDVAEQMRDHALGQVPGLDLVVHRQLLDARHQAPVPTDHALEQTRVAQVVEATLLAIALPCGVDQREVARGLRGLPALGQRHGDALGKADTHKAAGGHGIAVVDELHRIGGADDLVLVGSVQRASGQGCLHGFVSRWGYFYEPGHGLAIGCGAALALRAA
ncbi:hypothetical protein D3C71_1076330 [compost metagenome]